MSSSGLYHHLLVAGDALKQICTHAYHNCKQADKIRHYACVHVLCRLCYSVDIEGSRQSSNIWDVYLCPAAFPASAAPAAPGYALQVLGRCGESPTAPKALSVWLDHVNFSPEHQLHLKVQTGPGGVVNLGHLQGIRHIQAQIEAGVDCVDQHGLAAAGAAARDAGGSRHEGAAHQHAGPVRSWRIARPSWWLGGLQEEVCLRAREEQHKHKPTRPELCRQPVCLHICVSDQPGMLLRRIAHLYCLNFAVYAHHVHHRA